MAIRPRESNANGIGVGYFGRGIDAEAVLQPPFPRDLEGIPDAQVIRRKAITPASKARSVPWPR